MSFYAFIKLCLSMSFYVFISIGIHIASFDNGSTAALEMFAEELLDLWNNPIIVDDISYHVVIGQVLMDDKGRESFCGVQGATSLAGCNLCHFEGRTFANRRVFDGARRYCKANDSTRDKDSLKNVRGNLHFFVLTNVVRNPRRGSMKIMWSQLILRRQKTTAGEYVPPRIRVSRRFGCWLYYLMPNGFIGLKT
jgi:hypothetical protein